MVPPETATLTSRTCEKPLLCKDLQIMHMSKMWVFRCAYVANSLVNTSTAHGGIVCFAGTSWPRSSSASSSPNFTLL
jgi:hypothetical protein